MDCQNAAELMPWYLNGSLEAAERAAVEEHLEHCAACRAELREAESALVLFGGHPPAGLLVSYAFERPDVPRELIEAHLAGCRPCADELALARASREALAGERPPIWRPRAVPVPAAAPPRPLWRAVAVAAAVIGLIGVGGGLFSWRALDRQQAGFAARQRAAESRIAELERELRGGERARLNVAIHDLWPDGAALRSAGGEPLELPAAAGPAATLILYSELDPDAAAVRLEIRDAAGTVLHNLSGLRRSAAGSYTLSLPLAELPTGDLRILIFAAGSSEPLETYSFTLD